VSDAPSAPAPGLPTPPQVLPHRYPFLFVDRILALEPGVRGVGLKNVSANEHFFNGHFEGRPVFPGVLTIEALAQFAGVVLRGQAAQGDARISYLACVDELRFRRPIYPGDQLVLHAELERAHGKLHRFKVRAEAGGEVCAEGLLSLALEA